MLSLSGSWSSGWIGSFLSGPFKWVTREERAHKAKLSMTFTELHKLVCVFAGLIGTAGTVCTLWVSVCVHVCVIVTNCPGNMFCKWNYHKAILSSRAGLYLSVCLSLCISVCLSVCLWTDFNSIASQPCKIQDTLQVCSWKWWPIFKDGGSPTHVYSHDQVTV